MAPLCPQQGPEKGSLYVNICSWKRVPAPQDSNSSLLVFGGKLETGTAEGHGERQHHASSFDLHGVNRRGCFACAGGYSVVDVAFNPAVLQDGEEGNPEVCVQLLSFVEKQYDLMLPLPYTVVSCSPKSSPDDLYRRLGFQQRPNAPTPPDTGKQTAESFFFHCSGCIISQLHPRFLINRASCSFLQPVRTQLPSCSRSALCTQRNKTRTRQPELSADPPGREIRI